MPEGKQRVLRFSAEAMALMRAYDFPGNVRELKNAIAHAAIMAAGEEIAPADLPKSIRQGNWQESPPRHPAAAAAASTPTRTLRAMREAWLAPLEKRYLIELLEQHDGNVRRAAEAAGVNTVTMYRLLKKRGLKLKREVRAD